MAVILAKFQWIQHVPSDLWIPFPNSVPLFYNNLAAKPIIENPAFYKHTNYIEI